MQFTNVSRTQFICVIHQDVFFKDFERNETQNCKAKIIFFKPKIASSTDNDCISLTCDVDGVRIGEKPKAEISLTEKTEISKLVK